jgi:hypothetical protein
MKNRATFKVPNALSPQEFASPKRSEMAINMFSKPASTSPRRKKKVDNFNVKAFLKSLKEIKAK